MGKSKPRKARAAVKTRPAGQISASEAEHIVDNADGQLEMTAQNGRPANMMSNLLAQLHSSGPEDRECACATLSVLISDPSAVPQIVHGNILQAMAPLVADENQGVRRAALGALRNMTVDGGPIMCDAIMQQNCFPLLIRVLQQYEPKENSASALDDPIDRDILVHAIHLLWNLCENNASAVESFNPAALSIFHHYNSDYAPLALAVAWCLYTVTENNPELVHVLRENPGVSTQLMAVMQSDVPSSTCLLLKTLTAGILQNTLPQSAQMFASLAELFGKVLGEEIEPRLEEIVKTASIVPSEIVAPDAANEVEIKCDVLDTMLGDMEHLVSAQQVTLELLTNLASSIDENDEWEDIHSDNSSDETDARVVQPADVEVSMETDGDEDSGKMPMAVQEVLMKYDVLPKAISKSKLPSNEMMQSLKKHRKTYKLWRGMVELQSRALLCLSNVINTGDVSTLGGPQFINELWSHLTSLTADSQIQENSDQLECVTCALRALAQKMTALQPQMIQQITEEDVNFLSSLALRCPHPSVRANIVRILASMGVGMASTGEDVHPLLKPIAVLLCCIVGREDEDLHVVAEGVDALMDVFSEDHTDPLLNQLQVIGKLNSLLPQLKAKMKRHRKELGQHAVLVNTVRANLPRFIQYKTNRLK
ncbi:hypothetical protein CAPTEDRAFT_224525 [Capitella teleta]|uniref:SYO1-like TPR repeats domain-containing protein n=1 Tax=Capitella teleta TaxID=283909 RepID=R7TTB5_CAPTE|nr:hypothetical protein CAPTEDRAFT_224525 [Capitella teleta]|eukprot:ELT96894.1 hypothetical protein CAPTEDRAFT_224525 [Capitella teleta]